MGEAGAVIRLNRFRKFLESINKPAFGIAQIFTENSAIAALPEYAAPNKRQANGIMLTVRIEWPGDRSSAALHGRPTFRVLFLYSGVMLLLSQKHMRAYEFAATQFDDLNACAASNLC